MILRKILFILFAILAGTTYATAQATDSSGAQPWIKAQALLDATESDVKTGGVRAVGSHVADLEQALIDGKQAFLPPPPGNGPVIVLTDGSSETLFALLAAAADKSKRDTRAIKNPYPMLSLYLGSYYNEIGKPEDALRVLDAGMTLRSEPDLMGETLPYVIAERGASLEALRRWDDALANFDKGLSIGQMPDDTRARLFRGRGYALTELNRLDDAEDAYKNSLKLDPDSTLAQNELRYIAGLKAGALRQPAGQLTLAHPQKTQ